MKLGFSLISHRKRHRFAEIDLIFRKDNRIVLVEVKTVENSDYLLHRISRRQRVRIENAFHYYIHRYPDFEVEFHYAAVDRKGHIDVFEDFLSQLPY